VIVTDASAFTDFLLGRPKAVEAFDRAMSGREQEPLHAPELIEPETLNALRGLARGGQVSEDRARGALVDLAGARLVRYPHAPLRERVWGLRGNLSAYDATYLALAEALDDPLLVTGDRALASVARKSLGAERVHKID
jgi:predicted nucleic acid-binding protein